jgi:signal transduction histidine kinase
LDFEEVDAIEKTEIGLNTLELRVSELEYITTEYASQDDTYYFMQNNMRHFINDIIATSSFIENEINFMIITDSDGEIRYSKGFDLATLRIIEIDAQTIETVQEYERLYSESTVSGIVEVNDTPTMIAAHKITYSDDELPIMGTLVCGRYIDEFEIAKLCDYSYQDLHLLEYDSSPIDPSTGINVWRQGEDTITGIAPVKDINDEPYLVLLAESPREIYHQAKRTVIYFFTVMTTVGIVGGILFIHILNKSVLDRILGLSKEVSTIDPRSLESKTLWLPGDDEISRLSKDIDGMLQTINEYQDLLTKRERMATIGETAAMVGHDLRNPLQVIYMLNSRMKRVTEKLRAMKNTEALVKEIDYIEENLVEQTTYMNKIVSDLQDFSKSIALQFTTVDLEAMVMDVLETLNIDNDITVMVEFSDGSEKQKIDGNKFRRVIVNLLTNAVQAMPEGGKLTVRGTKIGDKSIISVSDTGVGVSEENMIKLFTPLFTTKAKGTGLGLAVCKRIINAHHGEITVNSKKDTGTTFTIFLPIVEQEKEAPYIETSEKENVDIIV